MKVFGETAKQIKGDMIFRVTRESVEGRDVVTLVSDDE